MGLGKLLQRTRHDDTEQRAAGSNFEIVIDGTPINAPASLYRGGMSIPGAWRCALLLSDLIGQVPWHAFRERAGNPVEQVTPTPLLLEQPNPPDTRMTTFSSSALDLIWEGNAVWVIAARNRDGLPTAGIPVPATQVGIRRSPEISPVTDLPLGEVEYKIGRHTFGAHDVIHIKGPCPPGSLRGFGVLEAHLNGHSTLDLAQDLAEQAQSISRHGVPTGTLKSEDPDLDQPKADKLKQRWMAAQQTRTVAVLNSTTDFKPLSWNPEELQLVEARKFELHEQALIFGVPLGMLGVEQSSRTYQNIEQEGLNLLKWSLGGHLARFEQTLSAHLPRGTRAKANLDSILRSDTLTRYQAHQTAIKSGFLTVDEVRELEDRGPLPDQADGGQQGGDEQDGDEGGRDE